MKTYLATIPQGTMMIATYAETLLDAALFAVLSIQPEIVSDILAELFEIAHRLDDFDIKRLARILRWALLRRQISVAIDVIKRARPTASMDEVHSLLATEDRAGRNIIF